MATDAAPADLQDLARRARAGDKQAQFDLGIVFEKGRGTSVNLDRARALYGMAAADLGGKRMVHVPTSGGRTMAVPFDTGPEIPGLGTARERLAALDRRSNGAAPPAAPTEKSISGRIRFVRYSDVCQTQLAAIQTNYQFHISECTAREYSVMRSDRTTLNIVDLALFTDDPKAISDIPIPFGLVDPMAIDLPYDGSPSIVSGTISYTEMQIGSTVINVMITFYRGR